MRVSQPSQVQQNKGSRLRSAITTRCASCALCCEVAMPRNEQWPPPKRGPMPKGYNTERVTRPLDLDSIGRVPLATSTLQEWSDE